MLGDVALEMHVWLCKAWRLGVVIGLSGFSGIYQIEVLSAEVSRVKSVK